MEEKRAHVREGGVGGRGIAFPSATSWPLGVSKYKDGAIRMMKSKECEGNELKAL